MKILNAAALVAVAAFAALGISQGRPPMGGPPGGPPRGGFGGGRVRDPKETADRQTQMMTPLLALTPDQQKRLHAIILKSATEMNRLREVQRAAIMKMLSADQRKKFEAMPAPGRARGGPGMGGPGMGGPGGMRRGG